MEPIIVNKISPEIVFMDNSINNAETKIANPLKPIKNIKGHQIQDASGLWL